jgi:hypothetical protein
MCREGPEIESQNKAVAGSQRTPKNLVRAREETG